MSEQYPRFQIVPEYQGGGLFREITGNRVIIYTAARCPGFKSQRVYKTVDGANAAGRRACKRLGGNHAS